jgi:DNA-binding FadR family transcriptional regulator
MTSNPCAELVPGLAEAVAGHLCKLIVRGVCDEWLSAEREPAATLDVGRPSVRLTLDGLAAEGLIERVHGKATRLRMSPPSPAGASSFI